MNRRVALTFAGASAVVVTVAGGAMAANVGILSTSNDAPVGNLTAQSVVELSTRPTTVAGSGATGSVAAQVATPAGSSAATVTTIATSGGVKVAEAGSPSTTVISSPAPTTSVVEPPATTTTTAPRFDDDDDDHDHDDDHDEWESDEDDDD